MSDRADVMIDLETLGTENNAPILSIGACVFDIESGEIQDKFYCILGWDNAMGRQPGRVACDRTVAWWGRQSADAREEFDVPAHWSEIDQVLIWLSEFIPSDARVWSNGANFDIEILDHAYKQCGLGVPWRFWHIRDVRTVVDLWEAAGFGQRKDFDRTEGNTAHHALDDALHQARYISQMYQNLIGPEVGGF